MSLLAFTLVAQLTASAATARPVLSFPDLGIDDSVAYAGYHTRFFRGADRNTVQIYLDHREGRVVHLLANGENESIGFSARTMAGDPAALRWASTDASVWTEGRRKLLAYTLESESTDLQIGRFVLHSMRVERDVQHFKEHRRPFGDAAYALPEYSALSDAIEAQPAGFQRRSLAVLNAATTAQLRARLTPSVRRRASPAAPVVIEQPSLDALDTLRLTLAPESGTVVVSADAQSVSLRATGTLPLRLRLTVSTTGRSLAPLTRHEIFTADFLAWANDVNRSGDALRARWIERQITGVELLASRDKLMAGLPTYATYFGRDMLLSALMMQPIWRPEMSEFVIAAALRKLSPSGEVSHEEALGGQALREAAAEATQQFREAGTGTGARADSLRGRALRALRDRRVTRENYHMVDDEYQLPLLIARYLDDERVDAARKRAWLSARDGRVTRLTQVLAALAVVADRSAPYAAAPVTRNFVAFAPREATATVYDGAPRWFAQSWRDSGAGYANGKFAMDVNGVYIPHALEALQRILQSLHSLGVLSAATLQSTPVLRAETPLGRYVRDSTALSSAIRAWRGAIDAFVVTLTPDDVQRRVAARLAAMPAIERNYWRAFPPSGEGIEFLALALDANGEKIAVANSDPATRLFLDGLMGTPSRSGAARTALRRDVSLFAREYPEGLLIPAIGTVVANDAYATPTVWQAFTDDAYHGPRVVWGREVNLFLLGVASQLPHLTDAPVLAEQLRSAAARVRDAVAASGFRSELWSYGFIHDRPSPLRYGSGGDVQLWSTTDLAVQYVWARLPQ
ncbi:hypothetical protein [Gemmatimonas sp.]